jgi:hypothetical protein
MNSNREVSAQIRRQEKFVLQSFAAKVTRKYNMCPNRWKLAEQGKQHYCTCMVMRKNNSNN